MIKIKKNRLEAFSDGVLAIIVTIMVLNIPLPDQFKVTDIMSLLASIFVFFVSFFIVGFFWHQHYQMFHEVEEITSKVSWRNLLFLFSLSLLPLFTKWVINNFGQVVPAIGYTIVFLLVQFSNILVFNSLISDEEKKNLRRLRRLTWLHILIWIAFIAGAILLSFFFPSVASVILIGLPLIFSLSNLWIERERPKDMKRGRKMKKKPDR